jgi:ElaB/YqjD/DUF883 family membrane-anchored ribosome-binding protein
MAKSKVAAGMADDLEVQFAVLKDDIAKLTAIVGELAKGKVSEASDAAREEIGDILDRSRKAARKFRDRADSTVSSLEQTIEERPVGSVLAALVIGFFIGSMTRR